MIQAARARDSTMDGCESRSIARGAGRHPKILAPAAALMSGMIWASGCGEGATEPPAPTPVTGNRAPVAVDSIPPHVVVPGGEASVDVTPYFSDPDGDALTYDVSSSDTQVVSVSVSDGTMTVEALGPGTVRLTVTASDPAGLQATQGASVQGGILTAVRDIEAFLDRCPTSDSAFVDVQRDFEVRFEGEPISEPIVCSEPAAAMSSDGVTYQLKAYQTVRLAYHMNDGTKGRLPWTDMGLYEWLVSRVSGVNIKQAPGLFYCCDRIDGRLYFATSTSRFDSSGRVVPDTQGMDWIDISNTLPFYAHEIRHADEDDPGHVTGCKASPLPSDPPGCDAAYDLSNLGGYGVWYWLVSSWATGYLSVGIVCSSRSDDHINWLVEAANSQRDRFVANVPPLLTSDSFEGLCVPPNSPWK